MDGKQIQMDNGLIRRRFVLSPNLACYDFTNLMTGEQLLRTVMPEARITLNGNIYNIGGLIGQEERGFFKEEWLDEMESSSEDFQYQSHEIGEIKPHFPTKTVFWTGHKRDATGKKVSFS